MHSDNPAAERRRAINEYLVAWRAAYPDEPDANIYYQAGVWGVGGYRLFECLYSRTQILEQAAELRALARRSFTAKRRPVKARKRKITAPIARKRAVTSA